MAKRSFGNALDLERCPHCRVAQPYLPKIWGISNTSAHDGGNTRSWANFSCASCGGVVLAEGSGGSGGPIHHLYPATATLDDVIPTKAREFLRQAIESMHAPAGAVMLTASSVDAMLKARGLTDGTLYKRIDEAAARHLITSDMAAWAHEVRLDANDQRHADVDAPLPTPADAGRVVAFTRALAEVLFVLPARITRGREAVADTKAP